MREDDLIDVFISAWREGRPEVSFAEAYRLEHHLRQRIGGQRVYCRRLETVERLRQERRQK